MTDEALPNITAIGYKTRALAAESECEALRERLAALERVAEAPQECVTDCDLALAEALGASSVRKYGSHAEAVRAEMKRRTTPETDHE
jgi:hypothetical protein